MAAGISLLDGRTQIAGSSWWLSRRRVVLLHGRGLDISQRVPAGWERRRRRAGAQCAWSDGSDREAVDVRLPPVTLYELLGISRQVGISEIKTAYREKVRRYHPDANPPSKRDECTRKFLQVQEAYEVLTDPELRADYDYRLRHPLSMQALKSGIVYKGRRSRSRGSPTGIDEGELVNKHTWKALWQAQVDGLKQRDLGRSKPGSWAAMMKQKREQVAAAEKETQQEVQNDAQREEDSAAH